MSYNVFRDEFSRAKPPASPAMMRTVAYYTVIPEHVNDFIGALKKISEITQKANYAPNPVRWYSLASGGDQPTFVLITDRASWAAMEPPEKTLAAVLKEADGDSGPQLVDQLRRSSSRIATELQVYRPDLSYIPK